MSTEVLHWCKSSHSGGAGDNCVEVARTPRAVHVRDTKDTDTGPVTLSPTAWTSFLHHAVHSSSAGS
ncbi:DUF397 domain-containing protein [Streptomyces fradiae]|uniref:DUF397 domain-containing protein n=1 Tax=Streptomyces fradiae TaxID=1906 RepID=UPI003985D676